LQIPGAACKKKPPRSAMAPHTQEPEKDLFLPGGGREAGHREDAVPGQLSVESRSLRWRWQQKRPLAVLFAVALAAGVAVAFTRPLPVASKGAGIPAHIEAYSHSCGAAFKQCGGQNFKSATCCQPGCICQGVNEFYKQCEPPKGTSQCSTTYAKKMYKPLKAKVMTTKAELAKAKTKLAELTKSADKLSGAAQWFRKEANKAAGHASWLKGDTAKKVAAAKEIPDKPKCASALQRCGSGESWTGPDCCQTGCECKEKEQYYAQCVVPWGFKTCKAAAMDAANKVAGKLQGGVGAAWKDADAKKAQAEEKEAEAKKAVAAKEEAAKTVDTLEKKLKDEVREAAVWSITVKPPPAKAKKASQKKGKKARDKGDKKKPSKDEGGDEDEEDVEEEEEEEDDDEDIGDDDDSTDDKDGHQVKDSGKKKHEKDDDDSTDDKDSHQGKDSGKKKHEKDDDDSTDDKDSHQGKDSGKKKHEKDDDGAAKKGPKDKDTTREPEKGGDVEEHQRDGNTKHTERSGKKED